MASEHAFLRQRLALVERWLANPDRGSFVPAGKGRVRRRTLAMGQHDLAYKREARLLNKLLARTREGMVLKTLTIWRGDLGKFLWQHRQRYREMQDDYEAWWRLPWGVRQTTPKPPRPPVARYVDVDGASWIINDRFLALLDDLIERLQKWLDES
jgi:hypothetical protein